MFHFWALVSTWGKLYHTAGRTARALLCRNVYEYSRQYHMLYAAGRFR